jgi:ABC-2 type transport system ATP-binding protein
VRRILDDVERRALPVASWQVREPTLDDVFLSLTGRPSAPADAPEPALATTSRENR